MLHRPPPKPVRVKRRYAPHVVLGAGLDVAAMVARRDHERALRKARSRRFRRRAKTKLTPVTLDLATDVILAAWRQREGIPDSVPDETLPIDLICADLADVLNLTWAPRWLRRRA